MTDQKPQGYAVQLYFDKDVEKQFFAYRESIYKLGLMPVLGKMNDRPHVSLAVFGEADAEKLFDLTSKFAKKIAQLPVRLESIGLFPTDSNVIYLTPIPTIALLTIHKQYHVHLSEAKLTSFPYYLPDRWVPHCTLESDLEKEQLDLAARLCQMTFSPIKGMITSLGIISDYPISYLAQFPLSVV